VGRRVKEHNLPFEAVGRIVSAFTLDGARCHRNLHVDINVGPAYRFSSM